MQKFKYYLFTVLGLSFIFPIGLQRFVLGYKRSGFVLLFLWSVIIYFLIASDFANGDISLLIISIWIYQFLDLFRFKKLIDSKNLADEKFKKSIHLFKKDPITFVLKKPVNMSVIFVKDKVIPYVTDLTKDLNKEIFSVLKMSYKDHLELHEKNPYATIRGNVAKAECKKCHRILPKNIMRSSTTNANLANTATVKDIFKQNYGNVRMYSRKKVAWECNTCRKLSMDKSLAVIKLVAILGAIYLVFLYRSAK
jgi:hypothetical protein